MLNKLNKLFNNFWFCISMAILCLLGLMASISLGYGVWLDVTGIVCWVYLAYRANRTPKIGGVEITPEQESKIIEASRQYAAELRDILAETEDTNKEDDDETQT